jgi:hypothetical protein
VSLCFGIPLPWSLPGSWSKGQSLT